MNEEAMDAVGDYKYGFHDPEHATIRFDKGASGSCNVGGDQPASRR